MERAATLQRAQSLKNISKEASESRQRLGGIVRRKSVSELVARYQNTLGHQSSQTEEKVQERRGVEKTIIQKIAMDLQRNKSKDGQVQVKEKFGSNKSADCLPIQNKNSTGTKKDHRMTTATVQENSRDQAKVHHGPMGQTQLHSGTKGDGMPPSPMSANKSCITRDERRTYKFLTEATTSTQFNVLKSKKTLISDDHELKKERDSSGKTVMETEDKVSTLPETITGSSNRKHYEKALPYLDASDVIPPQRHRSGPPSVKERSALYLSRTAAVATAPPAQHSRKSKEDIDSFTNQPPIIKHRSMVREICPACFKPIYSMERMVVENVVLHQSCFLCKHCNKKLSLHNYGVHLGGVFCKDHHTLLMKAKENSSGSLKSKKNQEDQLNKSIMSTTKTQNSKVKTNNHKKENTERKLKTDPQGNIGVSGQMRKLQSDNHQDLGRRLRIHWPPLQNSTKGLTSNPNRPVVTRWPPVKSVPSFQTNKTTLIKLDLTINKTQKHKPKDEKFLEINKRALGIVPITKPGSNISAGQAPGDGRRKLQELTQKLKSHNGNIPKGSREVRYGRRLVESTSTFQLTNNVIPSIASAPSVFPPTHLKVFKVTKPTIQKPVGEINRGFNVSSSMMPVNVENVEHVRQSSTNTLIPLSTDILQSGIPKTDPNPGLPDVSANTLITKPKLHQDSGDLAILSNEELDFQEESKTDTDHSTAHKEESGYISTNSSESLIPTTEPISGHINENILQPESTKLSNVRSNGSERLTFGRLKEVVDVKSQSLVGEASHVEYVFPHVKYPAESQINIIASDNPSGEETEKIGQSHMMDTDMGESENTFQEITTERNTDTRIAEYKFSTCDEQKIHSQDSDSEVSGHKLSNETVHQDPTRDDVVVEVIQSLAGTENLSVGANLGTNAAAVEQPDMSPSTSHITVQIHTSNKMLAGTNIHTPKPPENLPKAPKINSNFRKSSHRLPDAGMNVTTVPANLPEVKTSNVTVVTTHVQENRKEKVGKEQSLKSSGFGKNPFSRLFPSDSKDGKSKKEIAANKGQVGSKTQSALGKIFGLSVDNTRKEEEVTKSHQKQSEESINNGGEQSQDSTGLDDSKHTVIAPNEKEFTVIGTLEQLMQSDKPEGFFLQPESNDTFSNTKIQAGNVHVEKPQTLTMKRKSDEFIWITAPDNSKVLLKESDNAPLPGEIQLISSSKNIGHVQPCTESLQSKEHLKHLSVILSEPLFVQEDPTMGSLLNSSPQRQETLQSANIGRNELGIHYLQSTAQTDGSVGQFRNENQDWVSHTNNQDFLGLEISLLGPSCQADFQKSELYDMGIGKESIQLCSTTTVPMSQIGQQHGLGFLESDTNDNSLWKGKNSALLLDIATDWTTTDTPSDIEGDHSILNPELKQPGEAWVQSTGDDDDTFGLGLSVGHHNADQCKGESENLTSMCQLTTVSSISEDLAADKRSASNSTAVASESIQASGQ